LGSSRQIVVKGNFEAFSPGEARNRHAAQADRPVGGRERMEGQAVQPGGTVERRDLERLDRSDPLLLAAQIDLVGLLGAARIERKLQPPAGPPLRLAFAQPVDPGALCRAGKLQADRADFARFAVERHHDRSLDRTGAGEPNFRASPLHPIPQADQPERVPVRAAREQEQHNDTSCRHGPARPIRPLHSQERNIAANFPADRLDSSTTLV
jgi:hypothetical protein